MISKKHVLTILVIAVAIVFFGYFFSLDVFAQTFSGGNVFPNPFGDSIKTIPDFIEALVNKVILPVGSVVVVIMIIYSGFLFVMAQGNETKLSSAKKAFMYAVIGTLILLGSWVIANAIKGTICALYDPSNRPSSLNCN